MCIINPTKPKRKSGTGYKVLFRKGDHYENNIFRYFTASHSTTQLYRGIPAHTTVKPGYHLLPRKRDALALLADRRTCRKEGTWDVAIGKVKYSNATQVGTSNLARHLHPRTIAAMSITLLEEL